ncbi:hypothetical protein [Kaistia adipata]|uniref:hypothetical protein n=1 Tax=Kaistia adipata TaxID=166954 RepID=UPI00040EBEC8|nr:hypothetical protein [Kaistia adipata]
MTDAEIDARIDVLDRAIAELLARMPPVERETVFDRLRCEFDGREHAETVERLIEDASETSGHPIDVAIRQLRRRHSGGGRVTV